MCEHVHQWKPYMADAIAYFEKREGGERAYFQGRVLECAHQPCHVFFFIPHNPHLTASECVTVQALAKAA